MAGAPVLARTLAVFLDDPRIDLVQVVIGAGDEAHYDKAVTGLRGAKLLAPAQGGATRQASVRSGLGALRPHGPDYVLIHDAVRPFVSREIVGRVIEALAGAPGAIAGVPVADTLKRAGADNRIAATIDRTGLWRAQTPQGFRFADILAAHDAAAAAGRDDLTDDAAVAEWAGLPVALVLGSEANRKLTTAEDLLMADNSGPAADVRTGSGFDVHRLVAGDHVWLCGVRLTHTQALEGHSDADVALHALTDALLGAIGDGDIGEHFPDTDPRWKNAASHVFLADALARVRARGGSDRQRRRHHSVRGAQDCPASRGHAPPHRRAARARCLARQRQGHHHRGAGLHGPARGDRGTCNRNRGFAVTLSGRPVNTTMDSRL